MSEARRNGVGYKNPPQHSRFKPGQSGNPKGRPRKVKTGAADYLFEVLMQRVPASQSGRPTKVEAVRLFYVKLLHMALGGNEKAMKMLLDQIRWYGIDDQSAPSDSTIDPGIELRRRFELIVKRGEEYEKWNAERLKRGIEPS